MKTIASRIGIAGYMGAGKSTAARLLLRKGARIIDADAVAKANVYTDEGIRRRLVRAFGNSVLENGSVSFHALGAMAFGSKEALLRLNAIVHPPLLETLRTMLRGTEPVILDAALIPFWGVEPWLDGCLWVQASLETRLLREKSLRADLDEPSILGRMRLQEEVMAAPTGVLWKRVDNDGSLESLAGALCALW